MGDFTQPVESPSPREIEEQLTPEEQALRRAELNRQRQQRYRERQREGQKAESSTNSVTLGDMLPNARVQFKNPFRNALGEKKDEEPAKPLTTKEADEKREKLLYLFLQGPKILDDILEIIVRDHEPVAIWQLAEDEAAMLVEMQLEQAKKDAAAARVVRKLVAVYDRMFLLMLVGPRLKATGSHIKTHGGLSFR